MIGSRYAELQVTSHFSFLRGASSCEQLFAAAAMLGIEALAVADRNSLAGIVRAHEAAKTTGVRLVVGCRLDLADTMSVLVIRPTGRPMHGSAACCRSARSAAARPNASSNGQTLLLMAMGCSLCCFPTRLTRRAAYVCAGCAMPSMIARTWR